MHIITILTIHTDKMGIFRKNKTKDPLLLSNKKTRKETKYHKNHDLEYTQKKITTKLQTQDTWHYTYYLPSSFKYIVLDNDQYRLKHIVIISKCIQYNKDYCCADWKKPSSFK
jgi:hypothetical protein